MSIVRALRRALECHGYDDLGIIEPSAADGTSETVHRQIDRGSVGLGHLRELHGRQVRMHLLAGSGATLN